MGPPNPGFQVGGSGDDDPKNGIVTEKNKKKSAEDFFLQHKAIVRHSHLPEFIISTASYEILAWIQPGCTA